MAARSQRIEILLIVMILVNICVIFLVLSTQKNEVVNGIKSKARLSGGLKELGEIVYINQSSAVELNTQNRKDEVIGNGKNDGSKYKQKNHLKFSDNSGSSSNQPVLYQYCPEVGTNLVGQKAVAVNRIQESLHLLEALSAENGGHVELGGWWKPENCVARADVAILIPYRKREAQLQMFLYHMHPILKRQLLSYRIFVIEQAGDAPWNKGAIYNIGFNKILKIDIFDCFIFHDVDLLLENDKNYYGCSFTPAHLSVAVDTLQYRLKYGGLFGGVQAFSKEDYVNINGYSNMYWGWGAEDDDLYTRVVERKYKVYRPDSKIGRYTMNKVNHFRSDGRNVKNVKMYLDVRARVKLMNVDGLNKVNSLLYNYRVQEEPLLTRILINLQRHRELKV